MTKHHNDDSLEAERARHVRSLFISDLHLGTRGCRADDLLDFLRVHDAETIYLIGDIVDGWRLKSSWYWPQAHNDVVQKLLRKARKGARLIYVPGNHDEFMRSFCGNTFGAIEVHDQLVHTAADGKRYLVIHGDAFDVVVRHAKWLALLGDWAYELALWLNRHVNAVRRRLGFPYWSLSAWAKANVKNAVNFIGRFEDALIAEGKRTDVDGVICGHIHTAAVRDLGGFAYVNTGDWVESCTAVVEHEDGRIELVEWHRTKAALIGQRGQIALPAPQQRAA